MDEKKIRKAVALAYETNSAAPRITGQGEGFIADAILAKAKELGIPTRTEPELVEFLMQLKLNELVPPKLYAAVAEVLAWAYEVDGKTVPNPNNVLIDRQINQQQRYQGCLEGNKKSPINRAIADAS